MDRLIVVRHGETDHKGRWSGYDVPLTAKGRRQAEEASEALQLFARRHGFVVDHLISSPYLRASQTATIIGAPWPKARRDATLEARARDMGPLTGQPNQAFLDGTLPYSDLDALGAETIEALHARMGRLLRSISPLKGNVVLVGHNAALMQLDHVIAGRPHTATYADGARRTISNASVVQLLPAPAISIA